MQKSTEVMKLVNDLIKAPQLNQTVQQMSKEMMKAGVIDEMMDDAIEGAIDSDDIEEETDAEVDKVTHCPAACSMPHDDANPSWPTSNEQHLRQFLRMSDSGCQLPASPQPSFACRDAQLQVTWQRQLQLAETLGLAPTSQISAHK